MIILINKILESQKAMVGKEIEKREKIINRKEDIKNLEEEFQEEDDARGVMLKYQRKHWNRETVTLSS